MTHSKKWKFAFLNVNNLHVWYRRISKSLAMDTEYALSYLCETAPALRAWRSASSALRDFVEYVGEGTWIDGGVGALAKGFPWQVGKIHYICIFY